MILEANHIINSSSLSFILFIWSPVLPSSLCNNHLRANLVEPFPQVWSLQVHAGLLPGAGHRRRTHSCGLRALQQRVLALCCTGGGGKRRDKQRFINSGTNQSRPSVTHWKVLNLEAFFTKIQTRLDFKSTRTAGRTPCWRIRSDQEGCKCTKTGFAR